MNQTLGAFEITTYLKASASVKEEFGSLVLDLNWDEDKEDGPKVRDWVEKNNAEFSEDGPHQTYILLLDGHPLATASFVKDDQDVLKKNRLDGLGCWGFISVLNRDYRRRGIGRLLMEYLDQQIQEFINKSGPGDVYLFTNEIEKYQRYGFYLTGDTHPFGRNPDDYELIMKKSYRPRQSA